MRDCAASNRIYRVVWSRARGVWMVIGELAKGLGKGSGRKKQSLRGLLMLIPLALFSTLALAAPSGGQVVSGSGSISQSGSTTTINQSTQNLSVSWKSFNVGSSETVNFQQPNSSALAVNRISDTQGSTILGHINANGNIYLINPNGIVFGASAQVNVGGLVASTLDTTDGSRFAGNGTGSIVNEGTINAAHYVALLGNSVTNSGVITAQLGTVAMGAGNDVSLSFSGNQLVKLTVNQSVIDSLVANHGLIRADGGMVVMNAGARDTLLASVVNNDGIVEARTVNDKAGTITLLGGMQGGTANVGGTLDASAPNGGNGGFIETSAAHVHVANDAKITTLAANGLNGTWLIDPHDYTIAASGGDITGTALTANLASGNVTILSSSGSTASGSGNINVNDTVSWSANTLTLTAAKDVDINAVMTATGTASLAMNPATTNGADTAVAGGTVNIALGSSGFTGRVDFSGTGTLSIGGTAYTVINSLGVAGDTGTTTLQGMKNNLAGHYALGANIDASATSGWNAGAGFAPVGTTTTWFTGSFDGLGHTVSNLTVKRSASSSGTGLFGGSQGPLRNVGMVNASIAGDWYVGALTGDINSSSASISHSYVSGGNVDGEQYVGGLAGYDYNAAISHSHSTASISSTTYTNTTFAGGLLGGNNTGAISDSYATGNLNVYHWAGGLVGYQTGGSISRSYATGSVTGTSTAAGDGKIGGLVGQQSSGTISDSYATGSVSGHDRIGGLVGEQDGGSISNSYATGSVSGTANAAGLIGVVAGTNSNNYWDTTTSGKSTGVGSGSATGVTGLTDTQMKQSANFTGFDFTNTWTIYPGQTDPLLRSFMTALTVNTAGGSKTYDGTAVSGLQGLSYSLSNVDTTHLLGTAAYSNTNMVNAGTYSGVTVSGLYSDQQGYIISYGGAGTVTINKAVLTVTANAASKNDNGFAYSGGNGVVYTGFVHGEGISVLAGSLSYGGSAQGAVYPGSYLITPYGLTASNYAFNYVGGTLTIGSVFEPSAADVDADTSALSLMHKPPQFGPSATNLFPQVPSAGPGGSSSGSSVSGGEGRLGEGLLGQVVPMPFTTVLLGPLSSLHILGGGIRLPSDSI